MRRDSGSSESGGSLRYSVTVPPQCGRAVAVSEGEIVEVVDVEGQQVGDFWAVDAVDQRNWLSTSHTRDCLERLFPMPS